jgi:hypothetical protein
MTFADLRTDVVILACAISAGIHGALVPEHFEESAGVPSGSAIPVRHGGDLVFQLVRYRDT